MRGAMHGKQTETSRRFMPLRNLLRQAACAYPIPLLVILISLCAGGLWSGPWFGAGRPGWAVLLLSLPWTIGRMLVLANTGGVVENKRQRRVAAALALGYTPVALACGAAIGLALGHRDMAQLSETMLLLFFPFTLPALL